MSQKQEPVRPSIDSGEGERFVITVSARALFDMEQGNAIFEKEGKAAYTKYQKDNEGTPLEPGTAMPLVKKLLALNATLPQGAPLFDVVLLSRNSADTAGRLLNSLEHHGVGIVRAILTGGTPASEYIKPLNARLFLSSNPETVTSAIQAGVAAATIMPSAGNPANPIARNDVRIAFDGDAVLFSDEAERAYQAGGLEEFTQHERARASQPLPDGPFRGFLEGLHVIQKAFGDQPCPLRTALVTARGLSTHRRALVTLQNWGVRIDEAMFLAGCNKGPFLKAFGADLFLDDSTRNIKDAMDYFVASGHVPFGARNAVGASEDKFSGAVVEAPQSARKPRPR